MLIAVYGLLLYLDFVFSSWSTTYNSVFFVVVLQLVLAFGHRSSWCSGSSPVDLWCYPLRFAVALVLIWVCFCWGKEGLFCFLVLAFNYFLFCSHIVYCQCTSLLTGVPPPPAAKYLTFFNFFKLMLATLHHNKTACYGILTHTDCLYLFIHTHTYICKK